jgi:hypothetical protein
VLPSRGKFEDAKAMNRQALNGEAGQVMKRPKWCTCL